MIVITSPTAIANETAIIHALFEEGLTCLHIRKPDFSETAMAAFLAGIAPAYSHRLVLHSQHQLAPTYGIPGIHLTERDRTSLTDRFPQAARYTTATHAIATFNTLPELFEYAFLSPVYPSISKPGYTPEHDLLKSITNRTNYQTKLIALGGITAANIRHTLESGFDDIALLGTLWNSPTPLENFKKCQQIALSY